jgi:ABC-type sulfate transport system substrate-binding protein
MFAFVFGFIVGGLLVAYNNTKALTAASEKLEEFEQVKADWLNEQRLRREANVFVGQLAAEAETSREDAQRYNRIRYYVENDHGELAIEAFYGPHVVKTADELDRLLDEDLDIQFQESLKD